MEKKNGGKDPGREFSKWKNSLNLRPSALNIQVNPTGISNRALIKILCFLKKSSTSVPDPIEDKNNGKAKLGNAHEKLEKVRAISIIPIDR